MPQGRLGNLIFQYQALNALAKNINFKVYAAEGELNKFFSTADSIVWYRLPNKGGPRLLLWISEALRFLAFIGVIGKITPLIQPLHDIYDFETKIVQTKTGLLKNWFLFEGWFQHDLYLHPLPTLQSQYLEEAKFNLSKTIKEKRVAIHCRFGDYVDWKVLGEKGVDLPQSFYTNAINVIREKIQNPIFIIFSDNITAAKKYFAEYDCIYYEGNSAGEDLAAIATCSHAIISASTFSWWAAQLIQHPGKIIIAPKYWAGYKSKVWYPRDIKVPNFIYLDVI